MEFDKLSNRVIGCPIDVHRELGPGLLESTYEQCLAHKLKLNGIGFKVQHPQTVEYKGIRLNCGYRIDVLVKDDLIVELKNVEEVRDRFDPFSSRKELKMTKKTMMMAIGILFFISSGPVMADEFSISFEWGDIPLCTSGRPNTVKNPKFGE